jgi:outer membrane lipoprotein-sorting protein
VWRNDDAKVGDRPCILLTVMHPIRRSGFIFHIARIFVDQELLVPLHYEAYDWPEKPGDSPPLLERYTYTNLKLNRGLTDADFDPANPEYNFGTK